MATSKARKAATRRYDEKNTRQIMLKLNLKTDADILEKLDSVENRQGYIKELIRRDICGDNQKSNIPQMLLRYGDSIRFRCFVGDTEYEFRNLHIEMLKKTTDIEMLEETTKKEIWGVANEYDCACHKVRMLEKRIRIE